MRRGHSVVMFIEGTRSEDGRLLPFKKGGFVLALAGGFPIVPVTLSGSRAVLPKGGRDVRPGVIEVVIGAPVDTVPFQGRRDDLIAATRSAVEAGFTARHAADLDPVVRGASRASGGV
jgi:1-acyl-sn-glycerol-3-phosphate acyltransferase